MNQKDNKDYIVFSFRLMGFLSLKGLVFKSCKRDLKDPSRFIFFYRDTEELRKLIKEYKELI